MYAREFRANIAHSVGMSNKRRAEALIIMKPIKSQCPMQTSIISEQIARIDLIHHLQ